MLRVGGIALVVIFVVNFARSTTQTVCNRYQLVQDKLTSNEEQSISGILALEPSSTQSTNILEEATNKVNNAKRTKVLF